MSGGQGWVDVPDAAYSTASGKVYVSGFLHSGGAANTNSWLFAETADGGRTFSNKFTIAANQSDRAPAPYSRVCVDNNDNVHVASVFQQQP